MGVFKKLPPEELLYNARIAPWKNPSGSFYTFSIEGQGYYPWVKREPAPTYQPTGEEPCKTKKS